LILRPRDAEAASWVNADAISGQTRPAGTTQDGDQSGCWREGEEQGMKNDRQRHSLRGRFLAWSPRSRRSAGVATHCVRECPAKAIRITQGQAEVMEERCVGCG